MDAHRDHNQAIAALSKGELRQFSFWLNSLGEDWRGDIPTRIHDMHGSDIDGGLKFSPEFERYVGQLECKQPDCAECRATRAKQKNSEGWRNPESRLRATRAFRKLRRVAPREFDCAYLYCINRMTLPDIAAALTTRAIRLDKPERYQNCCAFLLLFSGIHKVCAFW